MNAERDSGHYAHAVVGAVVLVELVGVGGDGVGVVMSHGHGNA